MGTPALLQCAALNLPSTQGASLLEVLLKPTSAGQGLHVATAVWHLGCERGALEQTIISNITCGVADLWWAGISSMK